jgi:hypothetical protein
MAISQRRWGKFLRRHGMRQIIEEKLHPIMKNLSQSETHLPLRLICYLLATGWKVPEKIKGMLQKSARIFVELADQKGLGFSYGRSIGAYGATAALEVLSAAAEVGGLLTEDELEIAYGYSVKVMEYMVDFWYDKDMESINMWEHGRKTDNYRNIVMDS